LKRTFGKVKNDLESYLFFCIRKPLVLTIILLGLLHTFSVVPTLNSLYDIIYPRVIKTLILFIWCITILRNLNKLTEKKIRLLLHRKSVDKDLFFLFRNVTRILVVFLTILWVLIIWKIDLTPIFASAGIAGIAIALAAKDTLANFFGGISIYMDRAYKVGDYVILETGERGEVVEVGIRSTKIKTRDDILITIPNSIMANSKIINESAPVPCFRIHIDVAVAYGTDLDRVEELLQQIANKNSRVVRQPSSRVRIRLFGNSAIHLQLLLWINDPRDKGLVTHNLLKTIHDSFLRDGITIPFPQREILVRNDQTLE